MPISLSYHASGVRVSDGASWAGLGWSLQAGGAITRIVRGAPDDGPQGFEHYADLVPYMRDIGIATHGGFLDRVAKNELDYQPDLYTFTMLGQSGSFQLGNDKQFHTLPLQPLHIQRRDSAFELTDASGTRYYFRSPEYMFVRGKAPISYQSAWYLNQIISADRADTIRFTYESRGLQQRSISQQQTFVTEIRTDGSSHLDRNPTESFDETSSISSQQTLKVRHIYFRGGVIDVATDASRRDIPGDMRLVSLTVLSASRRDTLQHVRLFHSYFGGDKLGDDARLRLDSVRTQASGLRYPAYVLTYNQQPLPNRLTGARDHWGYTNGAAQPISPKNTPLHIPTTLVGRYFSTSPYVYSGADREPNPKFVQAGLLTQIRYPTGGYQKLVYEPNTVAKRYTVPTPVTTVELQGNGPGDYAEDQLCQSKFQTLTITEEAPIGTYSLYASHPLTTEGRGHHNAVATITDITPGYSQTVVTTITTQFGTTATWAGQGGIPWKKDHVYQVELRVCGSASARLVLTHQSGVRLDAYRNEVIGGVRIRELHLQPAPQQPLSIKRYYYQAPGSTLSSGYLVGKSVPLYSRQQITRVRGVFNNCSDCGMGGPPPPPVDIVYTVLSSNSYTELSGSDRVAGYYVVQVVDSSSTGETAGRTISWYGSMSDDGGGWNPPVPQISNSWQRDHLLRQDVYTTERTGQQLVSRLENEYKVSTDSVQIMGFSAGLNATITYDPFSTAERDGVYAYGWEKTRQTIGWQALHRTKRYQYNIRDTTSYHLSTTSYQYANPRHQQPTLVETTVSGEVRQQRTRYAADYDTAQVSSSEALAIRQWLRNHQVSQVLEQTTLRIRGTDTLVTQGSLLLPRILSPGIVVPNQQLALRLAAPISVKNFTFSAIRQGALTYATAYQPELIVDHYDTQARITQAHTPRGVSTSYLWDQFSGQLLAEGKALSLDQLAFSSFEPGASGSWTFTEAGRVPGGLSGEWSYDLAAGRELTRAGLAPGIYQLSFWAMGVPTIVADQTTQFLSAPVARHGNWALYQVRVPIRSSIRLNSQGTSVRVDEVRLHLVGSQLATYTYRHLVGLSSQTGPDGRTLFYEYDALGRLQRVRDEQGRILSENEYRYARP
ncbi:RHS repeat protein [Hymenobacter sp. HSC-4F20]|uniref:RHS repeat domain-containing protein n=1 Tax=Hymenobacter sp. HSC-4F20 TaxID=2864135 RepID=UPI001C739109|nr:RHS repeat domain-containing protein [Hymenobacter sp. HSC-4F20]MBX0293152.1 RHS repeat protein [Hymenobacter sp. HSC-4F20]